MKIEQIDNFRKFLEKYKVFRELPEQYKSTKFCKLYYKMYEYILSIPKEKIVLSDIVKENLYLKYFFRYISKFLEAKDFYHWKDRIYSLLTEKLGATSKRKYKLLYGSDWEEFYNRYLEKYENTCMKNLGVKRPYQSKEVQDKMKATCLAKYGREHVGGWFNLSPYSKFGDEVCTAIDNLLGNPEDSIYYAKSGKEYCIHTDTKNYYIDMVIPSLGLAFEADGCYYHGLIEGQVDVKGTLKTDGSTFTLSGNGSAGLGGVTINVLDGAKIEADKDNGIAIYMPNAKELNIGRATITGETGVYIKSGTTNINGATINAHGKKAAFEHNGNGANATGSAIVVEACGYPGGDPVVNIVSGEFNSVNNKPLEIIHYNGHTASISTNMPSLDLTPTIVNA